MSAAKVKHRFNFGPLTIISKIRLGKLQYQNLVVEHEPETKIIVKLYDAPITPEALREMADQLESFIESHQTPITPITTFFGDNGV